MAAAEPGAAGRGCGNMGRMDEGLMRCKDSSERHLGILLCCELRQGHRGRHQATHSDGHAWLWSSQNILYEVMAGGVSSTA
jgi:hypothetical protein